MMGSFQKSIILAESEHNTIQDQAQYTYPYTCLSILVGAGETCDDLVSRCSISAASFTSLNPTTVCTSLSHGKPVCCGPGETLFPPESGAYCYVYTIRDCDTCAKIAKGYKITTADVETWNTNTTAWYGCNKPQQGGQVCLSKGEPPTPVAIGGAVCGPQVPGTARPVLWTDIASLNPCPAGQCCSTKGKCGTGADFCDSSAPAAIAPPVSATKVAPTSKTTSVKNPSVTEATSEISETKGVPLSARSFVTITAEAVTVTVKAGSSTPSENADSHGFTTDIPLVDVPLTYLHTEDIKSAPSATHTNAATGDVADFLKPAEMISALASQLRTMLVSTITSTTKAPATATQKESSETKRSPTQTINGVVTVPSGWSLMMFDGIGCTGSYVLLQGHNKKLEDSDCMKFRAASKLETVVNDTAVSCRWWTLPDTGKEEALDLEGNDLNYPTTAKQSAILQASSSVAIVFSGFLQGA
ncbi:hypothetical protein PDIG_05520 [Penicillium digitatum PHI26]|uniref:LysM domain-containing protein n=2 Tax=Penicillium digitatum TaxID=36651 RepID=K9GAS6_PEND2|nr:hypothetical protein PDIP_10190 [Penicillium digitatum Pd1]EKV19055.1 hypothetical protein PDIG_05520 [Penicillium digitatum PHI26]EKV21065.1 hypothetical protein PDIP_10190 [Penicillium digitatum Pd1]